MEVFIYFLRNTKAGTKENSNLFSILFLNAFNKTQTLFKMSVIYTFLYYF